MPFPSSLIPTQFPKAVRRSSLYAAVFNVGIYDRQLFGSPSFAAVLVVMGVVVSMVVVVFFLCLRLRTPP